MKLDKCLGTRTLKQKKSLNSGFFVLLNKFLSINGLTEHVLKGQRKLVDYSIFL
ncbi:hypothetical protein D1872_59300 [compost metagenome]